MKGEIKPTTKAKYNQTFNLKKKIASRTRPSHRKKEKNGCCILWIGKIKSLSDEM